MCRWLVLPFAAQVVLCYNALFNQESFMPSTEKIEAIKNSIGEISTVELNTENFESIKKINKHILKDLECIYTADDISDIVAKMYNVLLSSDEILKTANKNKLLKNGYMAKKQDRSSIFYFSTIGLLSLLPFLMREFAINPRSNPDDFITSIQQMKEGKLEHV